jgi:hypothetical protein
MVDDTDPLDTRGVVKVVFERTRFRIPSTSKLLLLCSFRLRFPCFLSFVRSSSSTGGARLQVALVTKDFLPTSTAPQRSRRQAATMSGVRVPEVESRWEQHNVSAGRGEGMRGGGGYPRPPLG